MISVQASVSKGWLSKKGGFEFNAKYYLDPIYRMDVDMQCHKFIKAHFPSYPIYNMEDNLVQAEFVVPDMILVGAIQPNMIIAAALGAEFVFDNTKDSDVKGLPLKDLKSADELPAPESLLKLSFINISFLRISSIFIKTKTITSIAPTSDNNLTISLIVVPDVS